MMTLKEEGEDLLQGGYIREASNPAYQLLQRSISGYQNHRGDPVTQGRRGQGDKGEREQGLRTWERRDETSWWWLLPLCFITSCQRSFPLALPSSLWIKGTSLRGIVSDLCS